MSFSAFTQTFQARVKKFQETQKIHKKNMVKNIKRQVQIVNPELNNDSEIEEIIRNPEKLQMAAQSKIFGQAHFSIVTAVEDIKEKYDEIITLESVLSFLTVKLEHCSDNRNFERLGKRSARKRSYSQ